MPHLAAASVSTPKMWWTPCGQQPTKARAGPIGRPSITLQYIDKLERANEARFFLRKLRQAPNGLTTPDLTLAIMEDRCMDATDKRALRLIHKRTLKLRQNGHVHSEKDDPSGMLR